MIEDDEMRPGGRPWLAVAAASGLLAVAFGAVASHALGGLPAERLAWIDTALRYHMLHSVALLGVAILAERRPSRLLAAAGVGFLAGLLLFSGLLYAMGLGAPRWLGAVVPLGGLSYMAGWAALLVFALRRRRGGR
ncbi:Uncharacterized membrane protein YgdD, TMEM256/DUF423 family [Tistlia consotensis]|uniref:Uncharacterized membrane protein YgdD, TMEM256/DUF423 family n=1 Tax=Tistlia consotensis USBA 355 TaxID=560819 RepID=A0A1Y6CLJ9_9PROT|nr:DUF423 domain-containing protein [Tistlia consotensis]SMF60674.1 Uncharacterized membrane protein YgdD, TMEM256/DUF423 family [Tistlia consotensis USBA 355]SNR93018.1 Uncharacterized membrane protein YgdD, TMEM256/DUF423 family [Tistlia consotensis]